jgi:hypothetical protein
VLPAARAAAPWLDVVACVALVVHSHDATPGAWLVPKAPHCCCVGLLLLLLPALLCQPALVLVPLHLPGCHGIPAAQASCCSAACCQLLHICQAAAAAVLSHAVDGEPLRCCQHQLVTHTPQHTRPAHSAGAAFKVHGVCSFLQATHISMQGQLISMFDAAAWDGFLLQT